MSVALSSLTIRPLTRGRWRDLEKLFGPRGACAGCWCMWWRLKRAAFAKQKGAGNKRAFQRIVRQGPPPGLLAYAGREPVGWCAIGPRENYPLLENSRVLGRVDEQPVWSVTCFFIARPWRRKGVSAALLRAAVAYAKKCGARLVEGYPVDPRPDKIAATLAWSWTGLPGAFRRAGFAEVLRRSPTRPIMRRQTGRSQTATGFGAFTGVSQP